LDVKARTRNQGKTSNQGQIPHQGQIPPQGRGSTVYIGKEIDCSRAST